MRSYTFRILALLVFLLVAACVPVVPQTGVEPTATPAPAGDMPDLDPTEVLVQYAYEPTFGMVEWSYEFGRVPPFTLLADGRVIYIDETASPSLLVVQLSADEASRLWNEIRELGFERLSDWTEMCGPDGQSCIADAAYTLLRVRQPDGSLREVRSYANFSSQPQIFDAIFNRLNDYTHPQAVPFEPEAATLFITPLGAGVQADQVIDWPLDPALLEQAAFGPRNIWATALEGEALDAMVNAIGASQGNIIARHDDLLYNLTLSPWLPGQDFHQAIDEAF